MRKLVIFSPSPALRAGLRSLLTADPDFTVVASGSSLDSPAEIPADAHVLVVTLDAAGPGTAGALDVFADLPVLVIADRELSLAGLNGLGLGQAGDHRAWGLIAPDASAEALQAAVRALAEGLQVASPELLGPLLTLEPLYFGPTAADEDEAAAEHLTQREIDVLREVAGGLTNKQIAAALGISEHTVKFHVSAIYAKLGAVNRTDAARKGARRGYIPL